jgi:repressor of nif and glnA expression
MEVKMHRNTELLISILSFMQDNDKPTQCCKDIEKGAGEKEGHNWPEVRLHLALLKDMGLVTECTTPAEYRLTSAGYDVIESPDPVGQIQTWAKISSGNNTPSTPSFSAEKHPLPPAIRSQRFN